MLLFENDFIQNCCLQFRQYLGLGWVDLEYVLNRLLICSQFQLFEHIVSDYIRNNNVQHIYHTHVMMVWSDVLPFSHLASPERTFRHVLFVSFDLHYLPISFCINLLLLISRCRQCGSFLSVSASHVPDHDTGTIKINNAFILEYWIDFSFMEPHCPKFIFSNSIFHRDVPGSATDCPCRIWCRGLTTSLVYFSLLFGNIVWNNSWHASFT